MNFKEKIKKATKKTNQYYCEYCRFEFEAKQEASNIVCPICCNMLRRE